MFDLIEQAEWYPRFLPWCVGTKILERSDDWGAAPGVLLLRFHFGFETRNPKQRPELAEGAACQRAVSSSGSRWTLTALGNLGCKINFELAYEISDGLLDQLARRRSTLFRVRWWMGSSSVPKAR